MKGNKFVKYGTILMVSFLSVTFLSGLFFKNVEADTKDDSIKSSTVSNKAISKVEVEVWSRYSHNGDGHKEGDIANLAINQPKVTVNGDETVIEGQIVRDHVGTENGTIQTIYKLIFDNDGTYKSGSVICNGGYETALLSLEVGKKYEGSFKFLKTSGGHSGSGSYIYPTEAGMTFTMKELFGKIKIDKYLSNYGKNMPNNLYSFNDIKYEVINSNNEVVDTLTLGIDGKSGESKELPSNNSYSIREINVNKESGQVINNNLYKVDSLKANFTTEVKTENKPVLGKITINKVGVESLTDLWNENYTLKENKFKLTSLTDDKVYSLVTDIKGKAEINNLPLGKYLLEEEKSSISFSNTFEKQEIEISWKDEKSELISKQIKATNQEIKGENELFKLDKLTGTTEAQGKSSLKGATYMLVYDDDSTGSSPHKKGEAVKWSDKPAPKLITGTKVTESVINGKLVKHGDKVVVMVDDTKFNLNVGNLAIGKYRYKEIDVPVGFVTDDSDLSFEIKKKDDKTSNIITPETKSLEQVIKIKLLLHKLVESAGETSSSGYNDIKINVTPREGTNAEPQTITTGIVNDEDGYASFEGVYGDYVITEDPETLPAGAELFQPVYIHVDTDTKTDKITIKATYKAYADEEGAIPLSGRQFSQSDNETDKNESLTGTVAGAVSSKIPYISLSKIVLTDKAVPTPPETPSIDVEKSSEKIPQAGQGNNTDKDDNLGKGDADTKDTAVKLTDKAQTINFRVTNNGSETLTHIKLTDKTIEGKQDVKDIKWTYQDKVLTINKDGEFELDGKLLELPVDDYIEATGTLEKLAEGELHADEVTVSAKGKLSGKNVGDKDKWYGTRPKTPNVPEKPKENLPMTGETKAKLAGFAGLLLIAGVAVFVKRKSIAKIVSRFK